ncbi:MAG: PBP1A family penicillin-binding protein [Firmicutes bacterium]|nr:PBP1A family penicillin-binding protein [Bacillota bacterium]
MFHRRTHNRIAALLTASVMGFSAAAALFVFLAVAVPLPQPDIPVASLLYDRNGVPFGRIFVQNRTQVPLSKIPPHLREAVIAVEDYRFYRHGGIDPVALARALVVNLRRRSIVEGGSTITQQLAKNLYLSPERTVSRKLIEAVLTAKLEMKYSKDEILAMYLNQIYFGAGAYGVEAASWTYFGKPVSDLDLPQSALLAGLIRSPEPYSPFNDPELALARRNAVLARMAELGYIGESQRVTASNSPLGTITKPKPFNEAPYFADYVVDHVRRLDPGVASLLERGGYSIYTTLDLEMQRAADRAVAEGVKRTETDASGVPQPQAALVALDPATGRVLAMVGGTDYSETPLNRAVQSRRQPGSAFKPFIYAAALDRGYPPTAAKVCEPVSYPGPSPDRPYEPTDYSEEKFHYRPMCMREAIALSDNIVAVRWAEELSPGVVASYARRLGIESPLGRDLSLALGSSEVTPLELAASFVPLANGGFKVEPFALLRVEDRWGKTVIEVKPRPPVKVLDENVAWVLTDMLRDVTRPGGTAGFVEAGLGRAVAGKTGTTDGLRDAWFVGYTPDLVAAVFVGYDHRERSVGSGGSTAAPIFVGFAAAALQGVPPSDFRRPPGVTDAWVCAETGLSANPTCPARQEVFVKGTEPVEPCPLRHHLTTFP